MKSKILETRTAEFGLIVRRREREDGLRFTTVEIPLEVWSSFYKSGRHGKNRMKGWLDRRSRMGVKAEAVKYFEQNWKLEAIASQINIPARTISDWRKQWRQGNAVRD